MAVVPSLAPPGGIPLTNRRQSRLEKFFASRRSEHIVVNAEVVETADEITRQANLKQYELPRLRQIIAVLPRHHSPRPAASR